MPKSSSNLGEVERALAPQALYPISLDCGGGKRPALHNNAATDGQDGATISGYGSPEPLRRRRLASGLPLRNFDHASAQGISATVILTFVYEFS